jgi:phosphoserine aminotransferase
MRTRSETYNFAAGPSTLPDEVLRRASEEMMNYQGCGYSVLEMSHRGPIFKEILSNTTQNLKTLLKIPDDFAILFLPGGGTQEFAAIPMNLISKSGSADYAVTGHFSKLAALEAEKYGKVHYSCNMSSENFSRIPAQSELQFHEDASYFYICANNTVYGTEWQYDPQTPGIPVVADMSSNILTKYIDFRKYDLIYAGVQKNLAPAGMAIVLVRKSLLGHELPITPKIMNFGLQAEKDSMLNTPPCWNIYMLGLMLDWARDIGGINELSRRKKERAGLLYSYLDESGLFHAYAQPGSRSYMNVTFSTGSSEMDRDFIQQADAAGLVNLKGHRKLGGMRASIYNAMPVEGVEKLVSFMKDFEVRHK